LLKSLGGKHFVHVQDERGHSAHFARTSYPQLSSGALKSTDIESNDSMEVSAPASTDLDPAEQVPDSEQIKALRQQAFEEGLQAGRAQAEADMRERSELEEKDKRALESERIQELLTQIHQGVEQLQDNPSLRHEPLKRLALHLAEQLVLAELSLSAQAIEGLVQRCVQAIDMPASTELLIELHPSDLEMLLPSLDEAAQTHWRLQADPDLRPGSVRVSADDSVVSDLVEHRLAHLAHELLDQPQRFEQHSVFAAKDFHRHPMQTQVQDVQAKDKRPADWKPASDAPPTGHSFPLSREDLELTDPEAPPEPLQPDRDDGHGS
jgi:flagellar biosynthesis/type III secretory pathway protein FliH